MIVTDDDVMARWDEQLGVSATAARRAPGRIGPIELPEHDPAAQLRPAGLYGFFAQRRISAETVDLFGIYAWPRAFVGETVAAPAMVFPYQRGGRVVNRAYRHQKGGILEYEPAGEVCLFNAQAIDPADPGVIWIVDDEIEAVALHEAGYPQVTCLPAGGPNRYDALDLHAELLALPTKIVLVGWSQRAGAEADREELVRRLGRHRCWTATWPAEYPTAMAMMREHGPGAVQAVVEGAEPYPISGVQRLSGSTLTRLRRLPPPATMTTGTGATDDILALPTEGRLIVVTGVPGHGKTSWLRFIMVHTMERHNRRWAVFSPEMQPWESFVASCAEVFHGKQFWADPKLPLIPTMTDDEVVQAEQWFRRRLVMLVSDAEDEPPTQEWLIERARDCVLREGVTDLLIDPWNEVEHEYGGMTETQYTGRSLQRWRAFGLRHGCNVWIMAHPKSLSPPKPGGKIEPPGMYDISGGANWFNKPDLGLTVHTPADSPTQILIRKARYRRFGQRGKWCEIAFSPPTGRYQSAN